MDINLTELKKAEVQVGGLTYRWNPHMRNYIYQKGKKNYFLDWQKIITSCKKVGNYIKKLGDKKTILFLTTQKQGGEIVKEQAQKCGMPYIVNKWKGGFLTNFREIRKKLRELRNLTNFLQKDSFRNLIKKEQVAIQKRKDKLQKVYEGVIDLDRRPDVLFIIGLSQAKTAFEEAKKNNIPVIAVCNTDCNPRLVDYVIPGNDKSEKSISFFANLVAEVIGKNKEMKNT